MLLTEGGVCLLHGAETLFVFAEQGAVRFDLRALELHLTGELLVGAGLDGGRGEHAQGGGGGALEHGRVGARLRDGGH